MKEKRPNMVFGIRPVMEAISAGKEIDKILVQRGLRGENYNELLQLIREMKILTQMVPIEKLNSITRANHQGIIAFTTAIDTANIENVLPGIFESGKNPLILVLDRLTDVRNFGAIARTAECCGVDAILVPEKESAALNADAVKTSAGALMKIPVCRTKNLKDSVSFLQKSGLKVFACTEKATDYYYKENFDLPAAIIMGSEETGIANDLLRIADSMVKIPMLGEIGSLNVSVATGIILAEAVKQRIG